MELLTDDVLLPYVLMKFLLVILMPGIHSKGRSLQLGNSTATARPIKQRKKWSKVPRKYKRIGQAQVQSVGSRSKYNRRAVTLDKKEV